MGENVAVLAAVQPSEVVGYSLLYDTLTAALRLPASQSVVSFKVGPDFDCDELGFAPAGFPLACCASTGAATTQIDINTKLNKSRRIRFLQCARLIGLLHIADRYRQHLVALVYGVAPVFSIGDLIGHAFLLV